jgi:hypothetical protein
MATVQTVKARRFMKALVNHFNRKVSAEYTQDSGYIEFDFGRCDIQANDDTLTFQAGSNNAADLNRLQGVISSHLARFTQSEIPDLAWSKAEQPLPTGEKQ